MLSPVFLFDSNYLTPALVSVESFASLERIEKYTITLIFVSKEELRDENSISILQLFQEKLNAIDANLKLSIIILKSKIFKEYIRRYHFSDAILYKLLLPKILPNYQHIIFFDCGMIFGDRTNDFLKLIEKKVDCDEMGVVGAFCSDSDDTNGLSETLRHLGHNEYYPAGVILYFDVKKYEKSNLYDRIINSFEENKELLLYAEQDLLCLVLTSGELTRFEKNTDRIQIDMADESTWNLIAWYSKKYNSKDYFYIKHIGSFKPWNKWVLHPVKALYLKRKQLLSKNFDSNMLLSLDGGELFPNDIRFLSRQILLLEEYYSKSPEIIKIK